jgi:hypothetical protein
MSLGGPRVWHVTASPRYGFAPLEITDPEELELLAKLQKRLRAVPGLLSWWGRLSNAEPLSHSEMHLDDKFTSWSRISTASRYALDHTSDNLRVLHGMLNDRETLPFIATYPLVRSALEGAGLALWMLGPNDPNERVRRHVLNRARELFEENSFRKEALASAGAHRAELSFSSSDIVRAEKERKEWYRTHRSEILSTASRIGMADPTSGRSVIGFKKIVGEAHATIDLPAAYGEMIWSQVSGLAHPSLLRAVSTLNMSNSTDNADGTVHVSMSSKVGTVFSAVVAALLLFKNALGAYSVRIEQAGDREAYLSTTL